jgi:hypothetical protein
MIGFLYILTGLLVDFMFLMLTGAMLGMTTPIFTVSSLILPPLFSIGPSLLLFSGFIALFPHKSRGRLCLIAGIVLIGALASWTVPRIGWQNGGWLVLEPEAVSLPIAYLILRILKKLWIAVLVGSVLSAPFCVVGSVYLIYDNLYGASSIAATELWLIIPGAFVTASFITSLCFRIA